MFPPGRVWMPLDERNEMEGSKMLTLQPDSHDSDSEEHEYYGRQEKYQGVHAQHLVPDGRV